MKAKIILLLCLFVGITCVQVSAQNKAMQEWKTGEYWSPVYCDGTFVETLEGGEIRIHVVKRLFKNGSLLYKEINQIKGTVTSQSGEVFKIRETDKIFYTDHWEVTWHYNLIGNWGTHYTGTLTYNYQTGEMTVGKTVCN